MLYEQTRVIIKNSFPREYELAKILPIEPGLRVAHAGPPSRVLYSGAACQLLVPYYKN